jgi:hypothetical protein
MLQHLPFLKRTEWPFMTQNQSKPSVHKFGAAPIATFAREAGKAAPDNPKAAVEFVKNELKGFETPEATERRERATLNELFKLLGTNRRV